MLSHIFHSLGGLFGLLFFLLAVAELLLIVYLAVNVRRSAMMPPPVVQLYTVLADDGDVRSARLLTCLHSSPLADVMGAGLARLPDGIDDARYCARRRADSVRLRLEGWLRYLAVVGTLGPVIGTAGTVYGIIKAFMAYGVH